TLVWDSFAWRPTRASFFQLAGTHVTRDFVEAPSQVMENWVWEEISLVKLSSHFQTGEALPKTMIEKMRASKLFGMALHTRRQISFALTDLELHGTAVADDPEKIYRSISKKLFFPIPEDSRFLAGFAHLMGYDAGYYGYAWADVMAADIFSRFKEDGVLNAKLGQRLREEIYEKGSSRDEEESLVAFLQRPLSNQAFFESLGVSNS
ncbi:MAG: oligopeptidase A, partial [Bradymonadales bacterium]